MNAKVITVLCVMVYATKGLPQYSPSSSKGNLFAERLEILGLTFRDSVDYNEYILNLGTIIEQSQQVALNAIEISVDLALEFTKTLATLGSQENILEINSVQNSYFRLFEDKRNEAFKQERDVSTCVYSAIQKIHNESQTSVKQITTQLQNITNIFNNYTTVNYVKPAKENLEKSYTVRERIYHCPFSFTDFKPFYLCLTVAAVLEDVVYLNQFALDFNNTANNVYNLVLQFNNAASLIRNKNVEAFNATALSLYGDVFVPCAAEKGFIV